MKIQILKSQRKSLSIQIRNQKVLVKAPLFMSDQDIHRYLDQKKDWIESKLFSMPLEGFQSDEIHLYGKKYQVKIIESSYEDVVIVENNMVIHARIHQRAQKVFDTWVENDFKNYLNQKVTHYCLKLGIEKAPFITRKYTSMHGRCNSKGQLGFNKYLYHYPKDFIDYVILHECAHLLEFNHSKNFYQLIENEMPNYKEIIASVNFL